ncbi:MAG: VOC family protein [Verrucomicrobiales bacterium]|nr:VOC family protein [Verrucomicrobiales bacterium]
MQLNHLNLSVTDTKQAQAFLAKYFGLSISGKPNEHICFLRDDKGLVLSLTSMALGSESEVRYPATFHIGFIQPTEADVNLVYDRLRADGYEVPAPSREHGAWTFYFAAPGGFTIEVLC